LYVVDTAITLFPLVAAHKVAACKHTGSSCREAEEEATEFFKRHPAANERMQEEFPIDMSDHGFDCDDFSHCYSSSKRRREDGNSFDESHVISQEEGDSLEDMLMSSPCTKRARTLYSPETASAPPSPGVVSLAPVTTIMPVGDSEHITNHKQTRPREWWKRPAPQQHLVLSSASSLEASSSAGSSSAVSNLITCIVCLTTYAPCQVEEEPSVMPANALLNYFSCKHKASMSQTTTATRTKSKFASTSTKNNNSLCTFCERSACPDCVRQCEECQQPFCSFCLTQEYHGTSSSSRTVCLDCCRRDPDPVQLQQDENDDDGMDMD
jgi:hypothetical protein